jgi:hypothetical protein
MSADLFISHAARDAAAASRLCVELEGRGFSCWLASRDVAPGENFQVAIVRAIRGARTMLLVFTEAANASDEVAKELALASQTKLPVVPLRVENVAPSETFAYEFATRQWIDFHQDWDSALAQLARHLSAVLAGPERAAPVDPPPLVRPATPAAPPSRPPRRGPGPIGCIVWAVLAVTAILAIATVAVVATPFALKPPAIPAKTSTAPPPANPSPANSEVPF